MRRGEVWLCDLSPTRGHEQTDRRPCLLLSATPFNQGPAGLVVVVPLTTRERHQPLHVAIPATEGGLRGRSFAKCEDIRSVSKERLTARWGTVDPSTLTEVEDRLRMLQEL